MGKCMSVYMGSAHHGGYGYLDGMLLDLFTVSRYSVQHINSSSVLSINQGSFLYKTETTGQVTSTSMYDLTSTCSTPAQKSYTIIISFGFPVSFQL